MDSELRQDLVSGDWILIAPKRGKRTHQFSQSTKRKKVSKENCDFEHAGEQEGTAIINSYPSTAKWQTRIILNKFPVVYPLEVPSTPKKIGPIAVISGTGHHEVLVTRDHHKNFSGLSRGEALLVFKQFLARYQTLSKNKNITYISFFQNWGPTAGASLYHPHYQFIAIPVIPPDVAHSLKGAKRYFQNHRSCVHCAQIAWERKEKKRIVFENRQAVVFCPFVSKFPFEIRLFPKHHIPFFENTDPNTLRGITDALQVALRRLKISLKDPDYNFFIHTAPIKNKNSHRYYHWHIEIIPKTTVRAGFELGTGIEINVVDPDDAARLLRNA